MTGTLKDPPTQQEVEAYIQRDSWRYATEGKAQLFCDQNSVVSTKREAGCDIEKSDPKTNLQRYHKWNWPYWSRKAEIMYIHGTTLFSLWRYVRHVSQELGQIITDVNNISMMTEDESEVDWNIWRWQC